MKKIDKIKTKVEKITSSMDDKNGQQNIESKKETKQNSIQPIIIDDVMFSTLDTQVVKDLLQLYNSKYLEKFGKQKLCVEIVGEKYFNHIIKTTQKAYNHRKTEEQFSVKYQKLLQEIYQNSALMNHFWSIDFSKLKVLNLSEHKLNSIEGITFMEVPNLVCLEIHSNDLVRIDCLSKVYLPKLKILTFYNNKLRQIRKLDRAEMPKLKHIQFDKDDFSLYLIQNISFLVKMQETNFQKIYAQDEDRILSKKLFKKLSQLFIKEYNFRTNMNYRLWKRAIIYEPYQRESRLKD